MIDPTTQQVYPFPTHCPQCSSNQLKTLFSGAEDLSEKLEEELGIQVERRFASQVKTNNKNTIQHAEPRIAHYQPYPHQITISTRIFDPEIDYNQFSQIILIQAEGLTASPEYLVNEEVFTQLFRLLFTLKPSQTLIADTSSVDIEIIQSLINVQVDPAQAYIEYLKKETSRREQFALPPKNHLILITSQEAKKEVALEKIKQIKEFLKKYQSYGFRCIGPYPAKMLKRKNKYSYHLCLTLDKNNKMFPQLRIILLEIVKRLNLQLRLNPKHIF